MGAEWQTRPRLVWPEVDLHQLGPHPLPGLPIPPRGGAEHDVEACRGGDNSRSASGAGGSTFHQIPRKFNGNCVGMLWNREAKGAGRRPLGPSELTALVKAEQVEAAAVGLGVEARVLARIVLGADLGFGRLVASATEAPNMFVSLV